MKEDDKQIDPGLMVESTDSVMTVLQLLVLALMRSGSLDPAQYAQVLLDFRRDKVESDSLQAVMIDRMLDMIGSDDAQVLVRRHSLQVLQGGEGRSLEPSDATPFPWQGVESGPDEG